MAKRVRTYETVISFFTDAIIAGKLKVGEKLPPEREIAEHLGVSRNSVREAIRFMDMTGVISSQQGSGNYITCDFEKSMTQSLAMMFALNQTDSRQINQLRWGLETRAAILVVEHASDQEIEDIIQCVENLENSQDETLNIGLDKQIHYTMAKASRNVLIISILNALSTVIDTFIKDLRYEIVRTEGRKALLSEAHRAIARGLQLRDRDQVEKAMNMHFGFLEMILDGKVD